MNAIIYKNEKYPIRTFLVELPNEGERKITISNIVLEKAIKDKYLEIDSEEMDIDNEIYFYVENEFFELTAKEICEKHLDQKIEFLEEA